MISHFNGLYFALRVHHCTQRSSKRHLTGLQVGKRAIPNQHLLLALHLDTPGNGKSLVND